MKKKEFLEKLRKKLNILEDGEVDDIILEYEGYIDERIDNGASEEEAVESFGDIDELADELLRAYKINVKKDKDPIGDFSKKVIQTINQLVDDFSEKSSKEILRFIVEIFIILFIIGICHIPVGMLVNLGKDIFYILSSPLNRIFFSIWKFILEFAYFILSILVFIRIFEKRYLKKEQVLKSNEVIDEKAVVQKKKNTREKPVQNVVTPVKEEKSKLASIGEFIVKICVIFLKFVAICILFGISCYLIGMTFVVGICVYLLIRGVTYFGLYLVMVALFLFGIIFFSILFNFVVDKKNNGKKLFISIMVSILFLGLGCLFASLEVAQTEFINGVPSDLKLEVLTEELTMTEDTIFIGNIANYVADNSLETVKVTYEYYPVGTQMSTNVSKVDNFVYLNWDIERIYLKDEILNHIINDLKEKKVYNYYIEPIITITANEENIDVIKKNRQKYYENHTNYSACEFVRTYTVEMVRDTHDELQKVEYLEDDLGSVKLSSSLVSSLEPGKTYEFTFRTYQSYIDTDIENVFDENEVVRITETDKTGVSQRQDSSCSIFY